MRVIGVGTSPHRDGMTAKLLDRALSGAREAGAQVERIRLVDEQLEACIGCGGGCWTTLVCPHDDAATDRNARLHEADGLIMAVPVYLWQLNGLASLFVDKSRWQTRSVVQPQPRNTRAAFGIACAGGTGTGCVLALQALYRFFYNQSFRGIDPLPVTRFNFGEALDLAEEGGAKLVGLIRAGIAPFANTGQGMLHYERLPYMDYQPLDELRLIVDQQCQGLAPHRGADEGVDAMFRAAALARELLQAKDREGATEPLSRAYHAGREAWGRVRA